MSRFRGWWTEGSPFRVWGSARRGVSPAATPDYYAEYLRALENVWRAVA